MNEERLNPDDVKLSALLRESHAKPSLPPRFQEGVWRRIEEAESLPENNRKLSWLEAMVAYALRPRFALAMAVVLIAAGSLAGIQEGWQVARQQAQARYLAVEAPNSLR
jgi:hypothetical protein